MMKWIMFAILAICIIVLSALFIASVQNCNKHWSFYLYIIIGNIFIIALMYIMFRFFLEYKR